MASSEQQHQQSYPQQRLESSIPPDFLGGAFVEFLKRSQIPQWASFYTDLDSLAVAIETNLNENGPANTNLKAAFQTLNKYCVDYQLAVRCSFHDGWFMPPSRAERQKLRKQQEAQERRRQQADAASGALVANLPGDNSNEQQQHERHNDEGVVDDDDDDDVTQEEARMAKRLLNWLISKTPTMSDDDQPPPPPPPPVQRLPSQRIRRDNGASNPQQKIQSAGSAAFGSRSSQAGAASDSSGEIRPAAPAVGGGSEMNVLDEENLGNNKNDSNGNDEIGLVLDATSFLNADTLRLNDEQMRLMRSETTALMGAASVDVGNASTTSPCSPGMKTRRKPDFASALRPQEPQQLQRNASATSFQDLITQDMSRMTLNLKEAKLLIAVDPNKKTSVPVVIRSRTAVPSAKPKFPLVTEKEYKARVEKEQRERKSREKSQREQLEQMERRQREEIGLLRQQSAFERLKKKLVASFNSGSERIDEDDTGVDLGDDDDDAAIEVVVPSAAPSVTLVAPDEDVERNNNHNNLLFVAPLRRPSLGTAYTISNPSIVGYWVCRLLSSSSSSSSSAVLPTIDQDMAKLFEFEKTLAASRQKRSKVIEGAATASAGGGFANEPFSLFSHEQPPTAFAAAAVAAVAAATSVSSLVPPRNARIQRLFLPTVPFSSVSFASSTFPVSISSPLAAMFNEITFALTTIHSAYRKIAKAFLREVNKVTEFYSRQSEVISSAVATCVDAAKCARFFSDRNKLLYIAAFREAYGALDLLQEYCEQNVVAITKAFDALEQAQKNHIVIEAADALAKLPFALTKNAGLQLLRGDLIDAFRRSYLLSRLISDIVSKEDLDAARSGDEEDEAEGEAMEKKLLLREITPEELEAFRKQLLARKLQRKKDLDREIPHPLATHDARRLLQNAGGAGAAGGGGVGVGGGGRAGRAGEGGATEGWRNRDDWGLLSATSRDKATAASSVLAFIFEWWHSPRQAASFMIGLTLALLATAASDFFALDQPTRYVQYNTHAWFHFTFTVGFPIWYALFALCLFIWEANGINYPYLFALQSAWNPWELLRNAFLYLFWWAVFAYAYCRRALEEQSGWLVRQAVLDGLTSRTLTTLLASQRQSSNDFTSFSSYLSYTPDLRRGDPGRFVDATCLSFFMVANNSDITSNINVGNFTSNKNGNSIHNNSKSGGLFFNCEFQKSIFDDPVGPSDVAWVFPYCIWPMFFIVFIWFQFVAHDPRRKRWFLPTLGRVVVTPYHKTVTLSDFLLCVMLLSFGTMWFELQYVWCYWSPRSYDGSSLEGACYELRSMNLVLLRAVPVIWRALQSWRNYTTPPPAKRTFFPHAVNMCKYCLALAGLCARMFVGIVNRTRSDKNSDWVEVEHQNWALIDASLATYWIIRTLDALFSSSWDVFVSFGFGPFGQQQMTSKPTAKTTTMMSSPVSPDASRTTNVLLPGAAATTTKISSSESDQPRSDNNNYNISNKNVSEDQEMKVKDNPTQNVVGTGFIDDDDEDDLEQEIVPLNNSKVNSRVADRSCVAPTATAPFPLDSSSSVALVKTFNGRNVSTIIINKAATTAFSASSRAAVGEERQQHPSPPSASNDEFSVSPGEALLQPLVSVALPSSLTLSCSPCSSDEDDEDAEQRQNNGAPQQNNNNYRAHSRSHSVHHHHHSHRSSLVTGETSVPIDSVPANSLSQQTNQLQQQQQQQQRQTTPRSPTLPALEAPRRAAAPKNSVPRPPLRHKRTYSTILRRDKLIDQDPKNRQAGIRSITDEHSPTRPVPNSATPQVGNNHEVDGSPSTLTPASIIKSQERQKNAKAGQASTLEHAGGRTFFGLWNMRPLLLPLWVYALLVSVVLAIRFAYIARWFVSQVAFPRAQWIPAVFLFLDLIRRFIWLLLRLDNEQVNNIELYKVTKAAPPLNLNAHYASFMSSSPVNIVSDQPQAQSGQQHDADNRLSAIWDSASSIIALKDTSIAVLQQQQQFTGGAEPAHQFQPSRLNLAGSAIDRFFELLPQTEKLAICLLAMPLTHRHPPHEFVGTEGEGKSRWFCSLSAELKVHVLLQRIGTKRNLNEYTNACFS